MSPINPFNNTRFSYNTQKIKNQNTFLLSTNELFLRTSLFILALFSRKIFKSKDTSAPRRSNSKLTILKEVHRFLSVIFAPPVNSLHLPEERCSFIFYHRDSWFCLKGTVASHGVPNMYCRLQIEISVSG